MEVMEQLLKDYPTGILSVVIDSYNWKEFISHVAINFKEQILSRDGKIVFRPDSGEPVKTTIAVIVQLMQEFGWTQNNKLGGFRVLPPQVGVLWGDGVGPDGIKNIIEHMTYNNLSTENVVFGMGGALLQKVNRDTQRHAFKSSYQERNGKGYDIFKSPIDGGKTSKAGKLSLIKTNTGVMTVVGDDVNGNLLTNVFENGILIKDMTFQEVRDNAKV